MLTRFEVFAEDLVKLCASVLFLMLLILSTRASSENAMAVIAQGGGSFPTMGGGSWGASVRFEYKLSTLVSLIFPVEYRFLSMGGFAESPRFHAATVGWGGRFYFSQLFWQQNQLSGFFAEVHTGIGYGYEERGEIMGNPGPTNHGVSFSFSGMMGYAYTFANGLVVGGGVNYTGRGFVPPIMARGIVIHPNPELLVHVGWAF